MTIPGMGMYSAMLLLSDIGDNKKPAAVARVALARKLLVAVWALLHDGVVFDEKVFAAG